MKQMGTKMWKISRLEDRFKEMRQWFSCRPMTIQSLSLSILRQMLRLPRWKMLMIRARNRVRNLRTLSADKACLASERTTNEPI